MKKAILNVFVIFIFTTSFAQSNYSKDTLTYQAKGSFPYGSGTLIVSGATWMATNLNVTKFLNGDNIQICNDEYDWQRAAKNRIPSMQYIDASRPSLGAYYNYYALTDPRGIIPSGYKLPTEKYWDDLRNFIRQSQSNKDTTNLSLFLGGFYGYINDYGKIEGRGKYNRWWNSDNTYNFGYAMGNEINNLETITWQGYYDESTRQEVRGLPKSYGLSIKCIKDLPISSVKTYVYSTGEDSLTGNFDDNGLIQGKGVYATKKYIYEGSFKDTKFNGEGIQTFRTGEKFIGTWNNGSRVGLFTEVSASGVSKKSYWNENVKIASEDDPLFQTIITMSEATRQLYLINNGSYFSNFKSCKLKGGSIGTTLLYASWENNNKNISVCTIGINANNKAYTTNDCITLTAVKKVDDKVFLTFKGAISLHKDNYSIESAFNSKGKIERHIQYDGQTLLSRTIELQMETSINGTFLSFRVCFMDDNGNPDCGLFSPYGGTLSRME